MIKSEIMQATGNVHEQVIKTRAQVAVDISHDAKDFDAAQRMLNANAHAGDGGIDGLLLGGQLPTFGFLGGLEGVHAARLVALKASILPELAALWKAPTVVVGQLLVMPFALDSRTQRLDLARPLISEHDVFDRIAFLFARVGRLLTFALFGATDGPLGAVDDECQAWTGLEHGLDVARTARRQLQLVTQRRPQYRTKPVDPLIGLWLAQAKQKALYGLHWVYPEIDQDKQQLVTKLRQRPLLSCPARPHTRLCPGRVALLQIRGVGCFKGGQQCHKSLHRQPGQTFQQRRLALQLLIAKHMLCLVTSLVLSRLYPSHPLFSIADRLYYILLYRLSGDFGGNHHIWVFCAATWSKMPPFRSYHRNS